MTISAEEIRRRAEEIREQIRAVCEEAKQYHFLY